MKNTKQDYKKLVNQLHSTTNQNVDTRYILAKYSLELNSLEDILALSSDSTVTDKQEENKKKISKYLELYQSLVFTLPSSNEEGSEYNPHIVCATLDENQTMNLKIIEPYLENDSAEVNKDIDPQIKTNIKQSIDINDDNIDIYHVRVNIPNNEILEAKSEILQRIKENAKNRQDLDYEIAKMQQNTINIESSNTKLDLSARQIHSLRNPILENPELQKDLDFLSLARIEEQKQNRRDLKIYGVSLATFSVIAMLSSLSPILAIALPIFATIPIIRFTYNSFSNRKTDRSMPDSELLKSAKGRAIRKQQIFQNIINKIQLEPETKETLYSDLFKDEESQSFLTKITSSFSIKNFVIAIATITALIIFPVISLIAITGIIVTKNLLKSRRSAQELGKMSYLLRIVNEEIEQKQYHGEGADNILSQILTKKINALKGDLKNLEISDEQKISLEKNLDKIKSDINQRTGYIHQDKQEHSRIQNIIKNLKVNKIYNSKKHKQLNRQDYLIKSSISKIINHLPELEKIDNQITEIKIDNIRSSLNDEERKELPKYENKISTIFAKPEELSDPVTTKQKVSRQAYKAMNKAKSTFTKAKDNTVAGGKKAKNFMKKTGKNVASHVDKLKHNQSGENRDNGGRAF